MTILLIISVHSSLEDLTEEEIVDLVRSDQRENDPSEDEEDVDSSSVAVHISHSEAVHAFGTCIQ